jgi:hypothetical protein
MLVALQEKAMKYLLIALLLVGCTKAVENTTQTTPTTQPPPIVILGCLRINYGIRILKDSIYLQFVTMKGVTGFRVYCDPGPGTALGYNSGVVNINSVKLNGTVTWYEQQLTPLKTYGNQMHFVAYYGSDSAVSKTYSFPGDFLSYP